MSYIVRTNEVIDTNSINMNTATLQSSLSRTGRKEKCRQSSDYRRNQRPKSLRLIEGLFNIRHRDKI